jgi:hypothetical protein
MNRIYSLVASAAELAVFAAGAALLIAAACVVV